LPSLPSGLQADYRESQDWAGHSRLQAQSQRLRASISKAPAAWRPTAEEAETGFAATVVEEAAAVVGVTAAVVGAGAAVTAAVTLTPAAVSAVVMAVPISAKEVLASLLTAVLAAAVAAVKL